MISWLLQIFCCIKTEIQTATQRIIVSFQMRAVAQIFIAVGCTLLFKYLLSSVHSLLLKRKEKKKKDYKQM